MSIRISGCNLKRIIPNSCGIAAALLLILIVARVPEKYRFQRKNRELFFALSFYKVIVNGQKRCCLADKAEDVCSTGIPKEMPKPRLKALFALLNANLI